jgi:hypothetical protein
MLRSVNYFHSPFKTSLYYASLPLVPLVVAVVPALFGTRFTPTLPCRDSIDRVADFVHGRACTFESLLLHARSRITTSCRHGDGLEHNALNQLHGPFPFPTGPTFFFKPTLPKRPPGSSTKGGGNWQRPQRAEHLPLPPRSHTNRTRHRRPAS